MLSTEQWSELMLEPAETMEESNSDSDQEAFDVATAWKEVIGYCRTRFWWHGMLSILAITFLSFLACQGSGLPGSLTRSQHAMHRQRLTVAHSASHSSGVIQLLESSLLSREISETAVRLAAFVATLQQSGTLNVPEMMSTPSVSRAKLLPHTANMIRAEAKYELKKALNNFISNHVEMAEALASVNVSSKHVKSVVSMLNALTDPRMFGVGLKAARECAMSGSYYYGLRQCLHQQAAAEKSRFRKLREELLPADLLICTTPTLESHHLVLLSKSKFKASNTVGRWHVELEVSSRRLQASTTRPSYDYFNLGAPVVTNALDLTMLSLMSLLPGTSGRPTDRPANYALWGVQATTTLAECLANLGAKRGVNMISSCIMDVMFLGLEVIWAFFDGNRVAGPLRRTQCNPYSQWPGLLAACGNCMGVISVSTTTSCTNFCNVFGHRAMFAGMSLQSSCVPEFQYNINEIIPSNTIICQCLARTQSRTRRLTDLHTQLNNNNTELLQVNSMEQTSRSIATQSDSWQQGRRLQTSNMCRHDQPYIVQVVTSNQVGTPRLGLLFHKAGFEIRDLEFNSSQTHHDKVLRTGPLFLSMRPDALALIGSNKSYGVKQIQVIHGGEIMTVMDSGAARNLGNKYYAQAGTQSKNMQIFAIPDVGHFLSTTGVSFTRHQAFPTYTLEIVTSGQQHAAVIPNRIEVTAQVQVAPDSTLSVRVHPAGKLQCTAVSFALPIRPVHVSLVSSGQGDQWGFSAIYFIDDDGSVVRLLDTPNGAQMGQNRFWIGDPLSGVHERQNFEIPSHPKTTSTTSTTIRFHAVKEATDIQCPPYSAWLDVQGMACGECQALVSTSNYSSRCDLYCSNMDLECVAAADDVDGTCFQQSQVPCHMPVPNAGPNMLCTCRSRAEIPTPPVKCHQYSFWPYIDGHFCGHCTAVVPLRVPALKIGSSCDQYCSSFNHKCIWAALQGSSSCSIAQQIRCSDVVEEVREAMCTCEEQT